jgi:hypothetical protein
LVWTPDAPKGPHWIQVLPPSLVTSNQKPKAMPDAPLVLMRPKPCCAPLTVPTSCSIEAK